MSEENSIFDLIERYHQGQLSEEERNLVERRIQTDSSFAEYVTINGLVNTLVYSSGIDMLREKMSRNLIQIEKNSIRLRWTIGAGIIAVLLALTSLLYFSKNSENKTSPTIPKEQTDILKSDDRTIVFSETNDNKNKNNSSILKHDNNNQGIDSINIKKNNNALPYLIENKENTIDIKEPTTDTRLLTPSDEIKNNYLKECHLTFDVIVQASCKEKTDGAIMIEKQSISGGTMPYQYKISDTKEESYTGIFSNLEKGNYNVVIYDSKGCSSSKEIIVPEKYCNTKKSYSFNPDYGENWKVPSLEGESGTFTIFNRLGITIFKGSFTENNPAEWFGNNTQGVPADVGLYVCVIEYSAGKTEVIEISIVR